MVGLSNRGSTPERAKSCFSPPVSLNSSPFCFKTNMSPSTVIETASFTSALSLSHAMPLSKPVCVSTCLYIWLLFVSTVYNLRLYTQIDESFTFSFGYAMSFFVKIDVFLSYDANALSPVRKVTKSFSFGVDALESLEKPVWSFNSAVFA